MMANPNTSKPPPTTLRYKHGYVVDSDCEIEMRCHDRHFRDTVFLDQSGDNVFSIECPGLLTSWSMRRTLRDAAGLQVLHIRHQGTISLEQWTVEDAYGRQLCSAKGSKSAKDQATAIDAKVFGEDGSEMDIEVRSADHAGTVTTFSVDGVAIAEMLLVKNNDLSFLDRRGLDRSSWKLKVVAETDLALIAALALCRAEVLHAWRR